MKKVLMLVATVAAMCSSSAFAQKVNLPAKGTFSTEVQVNPFGNDFDHFKLDDYKLKMRYFMTDKDALRLSVGLHFDKKNDPGSLTEPDGDDVKPFDRDFYNYKNDNNENVTKQGGFSLDLGYERHFLKTGRVDLYAGAEIGIGLNWSKSNIVEGRDFQKDDFDPDKSSTYSFYTVETETNDGGFFEFGAGVFTGIDFYIYKGLYIGTELGLNLNNRAYGDFEKTVTNNHPKAEAKDRVETTKETNNKSEFNLKFYVEPAIRLGWAF